MAMPAQDQVPTFRHEAKTPFGTFRSDFAGRQYPLAVVYCGWHDLPDATRRRLREREGICYGYARDMEHAQQLSDYAVGEGCLNVIIVKVDVRQLPSRP